MYNDILNFIISLIPTKLETYTGGVVAVIGIILQHLFGPWSDSFETLLILMVIDYITGISAAYINPNMKLDSSKCGAGALKKVVILLIIATTYRIDLIGQTMAKDVVLLFFIGREGLSILENAANCGLPIPQKLKDTLAQFTEAKNKK
ncbi:phage holin family protein [Megamonas hypermegale]|uniref:phage holin family protein n=1 Tax=Megamonas hypermegale TaxID=158847 RepID=UPI00195CE841|nr:phage holin family protein [Megamonas hypermegale]MBM6760474.1 phage holin family protein [Megamonas hypermegale]